MNEGETKEAPPKLEELPVRFSGGVALGAALVALGQVVALGIGGLALRDGVLSLTEQTCPMGEFGATMYAMMALIGFDPPLAVATGLLVWLARRQLPRWVRTGLLVGLVVAIIVPLAALAFTFLPH
jgi:hypothetical protein